MSIANADDARDRPRFDRGGAGSRQGEIDLRQLVAEPAQRHAAGLSRRPQPPQRRAHRCSPVRPAAGKSTLFRAIAGIWPFGKRLDRDSGQRLADDAAAAAVFSDRVAARGDRLSRRSRNASARTRSGRCSTRSACRSSARGWTRKRTGTGCSRSASSSVSGWRARCCMRRNICSSTRPPLRSMNPRKPRCTAC